MTKKQLIEVIRKVVRQEVKKQVDEIFIQESVKKVAQPKKISQSKKTYVKDNKALNDILNETVALSKGKSEEYPTMGGKTFTTNDMADLLGYGDMKPNGGGMSNQGVAEIAHKAGVAPEQIDPDVQKAITKDYRELMSKMNLKK